MVAQACRYGSCESCEHRLAELRLRDQYRIKLAEVKALRKALADIPTSVIRAAQKARAARDPNQTPTASIPKTFMDHA